MRAPGFLLAIAIVIPLLAGCAIEDAAGTIGTNPALPNTAQPYLGAQGPNVIAVTIGGTSLCGKMGYENEPCASATVCVPGTSQCQTITDLLVDTGSVGLRVFSSALHLTLPPVQDSSGHALAECAQFGTGSDWGPIADADVVLGAEPPVTVPIQIIDKSYPGAAAECAQADVDPAHTGYNGILGMGLFTEDCGAACEHTSETHVFFSCTSTSCAPITLPRVLQPRSLITGLPADNNGLILALPQVELQGAAQVSGVLILGIGTQSNNGPIGVSSYPTDGNGNFVTSFGGASFPGSFADSGSNGLFFPNVSGLQGCSQNGPAPKFYCPGSPVELSATNLSAHGDIQAQVPFEIANAELLLQNPYAAYSDLGGQLPGSFDWGLPFFFGRAVFIGVEGRDSSLGTGPVLGY